MLGFANRNERFDRPSLPGRKELNLREEKEVSGITSLAQDRSEANPELFYEQFY